MKKLLFLVAVSLGLILGPYSWAQNTVAPASVTAPAVHRVAMHKKGKHERHPEIRIALHRLRMAKANLEKAAHDYAGHRVKAIESIKTAIHELEEALRSDKT